MKRTLPIISVIAFAILVFCASCIKEKSYQCHCTYVANVLGPNAGQPNKEETTTLKGNDFSGVDIDCTNLETKYDGQFYQGTCVLQ